MSRQWSGKNPRDFGDNIPQVFSHQAKLTPNRIALTYQNQSYTYLELNEAANRLANFLVSSGVMPNTKVAIAINRSAEMIIGILGILKARAAYVPIDPNYPNERIDFLLADAQTELILTSAVLKPAFEDRARSVIAIDQKNGFDNFSSLDPEFPNANDLAYSIYTSGSTGHPKGVLIEHHSVINLIAANVEFAEYDVERFLFTYSFSFDGSVILIWWTLLSGGTLVMAEDELEKDLTKLANFISKEKITQILTFPSLYHLLLSQTDLKLLNTLRSVTVAGEACPGALVRLHHSKIPFARFFNQYGPTEATVGCTVYETSAAHSSEKTPIGKAFSGTQVIILNEDGAIAEINEIGEIHIGGAGVARGYFNRPILTAEKFINNKFGPGKLYKSGDLGRLLPDGNIDFVGRKDTQVKLRGYRIELGEIEAALVNINEVKEAVVILHGERSKDQKLIAYIQCTDQIANSAIKEELAKSMPEYMLPALFINLDKFPLAPSGKIDRNNLPQPSNGRPQLDNNYAAPSSKLEHYLVDLWEKALGIHPIGVDDKFFELGGNSLQAAGFTSEIQQLFDETIFIVTVFEYPTIAQYSAMLARDYSAAVDRHFGVKNELLSTGSSEVLPLKSREIKAFLRYVPQRQEVLTYAHLNDPAIFILAPPRSGTSLLRTMLSGHPKIFGANELQLLHFENMQERAKAYSGKFALWKEGLVRSLMEIYNYEVDQAKSQIQQWENQKASTQSVFTALQDKLIDQMLLDKSPSYALDINAMRYAQACFNNAKFIHISRHPIAMIDSFDRMHMDQVMYLNAHPYRGKNLGELIWNQSHKNILQFFKEIPAENHFTLQYEALVKKPEKMAYALCEFLNIDFHPEVAQPYKNLDTKMTDGIYKDSKPMGDVNFLAHGKIKASLADNWKKKSNYKLNKDTLKVAESLGYVSEKNKNSKANKKRKRSAKKTSHNAHQDIAIIGMNVRLPGAKNINEFWDNLKSGKDVSRNFSPEELRNAGVKEEDFSKENYVKRGVVLDNYDRFDAEFFGYLPKEAALMDPQHRIYLEVAYGAMEDAGIVPQNYKGKIGIFGGVARNTYLVNNVMTHPQYFDSLDDFQLGIALEKDFPATRVAYKLNLNGPAVNVQTACSSSGVAVHLACLSIQSGDADIILVGGGRIQPPVEAGYQHTDGHALSPTGYCHTFDANASGMVRGQGMAFIAIKKLSKAIEDGDNIRAIIKGSAINNDGNNKIGFTAPSALGQAEAIKAAYKNAGISPAKVSYIEAHGTGTKIGDPIELSGLQQAFKAVTNKKQFCRIASVKSNIGHLDAGACVVGIIKTTLALENELLPATLNYSSPNPQIDFKNSPFLINDQLTSWKRSKKIRYAGVSSLGLGGTNAHVVLAEAPLLKKETSEENFHLLPISGKRHSDLIPLVDNYMQYLERNSTLNIAALAHTLQLGRQHFKYKNYVVGKNQSELLDAFSILKEELQQEPAAVPVSKKIAFMFPGGGAQYVNMGRSLYQNYDTYKKWIDLCCDIVQDKYNIDLINILFPKHSESKPITDPLHGILLLFIAEYANAKLWESWGVIPDVMIGHSLGEYTAACLAQVFTLEEALEMVHCRGALFQKLPEGGMLSIGLPPDEVRILIGDRLDFAAINRPDHCVVSGSAAMIDEVKQELNRLEIHATRPQITVAAHSRMIELILPEFKRCLDTVNFKPAQRKVISNLDGSWANESTFSSPEYWLNHLRNTVRFSDGIAQLFKDDDFLLLEVGPGQTLSTFSRQHLLKPASQVILASQRHPKEGTHDVKFILKTLGELYLANQSGDWNAYNKHQVFTTLSLPTYPFQKTRHWIDAKPLVLETLPINPPDYGKQVIMNPTSHASSGDAASVFQRNTLLLEQLKDVFHEMSGIPQSKMSDKATFLEMGFDSLFLTQAVSKLKKKYKVKLSFRQLFDELPNLRSLSSWLDRELDPKLFVEDVAARNNQLTPQPAPVPLAPPAAPISMAPMLQQPTPHPSQPEYHPMPLRRNPPAAIQGDLASIVQQQLELMQQQIWLLSGNQQAPPLPPKQQQIQNITESDTPNKDEHLGKGLAPSTNLPEEVLSSDKSEPIPSVINAAAFRELNKSTGQKIRKISSWEDLSERESKYLKALIKDYTSKTYSSQSLTGQQRKHLSDPRSISGFNPVWKDVIYQIAVERSKGAKLWDLDGNEYIDYGSSFGISLFGHSPDFIQSALRLQIGKGFELGVLSPLARKVADILCELTGFDRVTLVNTGSECLSASVRAARTVTGRDKIAVFEGDYHGIADELLVRSIRRNGESISLPVASGIPASLVENVIVLHYDDPNVLDIIREHADDLAAVLIEPVQPNNPAFQPKELIHNIRKITKELDIAMIFDEMITGFRLALGGAQEWYGVKVDMVAYGKIISGGLPMAALAGEAKYLDAFDGGQWQFGDDSVPPAGVTFFGGTFVKHPLSLSASLAALEAIREGGRDLFKTLNERSEKFARQIAAIIDETKAPLKVYATASIICIKGVDQNPFIPLFYVYCRLKGIHITGKAALITLSHTEEDLEKTLKIFKEVIGEMQTAGFFPITVKEPDPQHKIIPVPLPNSFSLETANPQCDSLLNGEAVRLQEEIILPLTEGQKEVWVEQRLGAEAAAAYNLAGAVDLTGNIELIKLQEAVNIITLRHEALRVKFNIDAPTQTVLPELNNEVSFEDLSELGKEEQQKRLVLIEQEETEIAFDLFNGPLIRYRLLKLSEQEFKFIMSAHHGVADGWSCGIISKEIAEVYSALVKNEKPNLGPAKSYIEFVKEETEFLHSEEYKDTKKYWLAQFEDEIPQLDFPTDGPRPVKKTYDADLQRILIQKDLVNQLKGIAAQGSTTLFILLYAAFRQFIHRLSDQDDFVLGLVAAAQTISGNDNLVTHGVSLLPVRNKINGNDLFLDDLKITRNLVLDAFENQRFTLGSLVRELKLKRDPSRQPIISFLFNMDADGESHQYGDCKGEVHPIQRKYETFDTFINVKSTKEGIDFEWIYNTDLFSNDSIRLRLEEFKTYLQSIATNAKQPVNEINLLPTSELKLIKSWEAPIVPREESETIFYYFNKQLISNAHKTAISSRGESLSYQELEEASNRVANRLLQAGLTKGTHVGVYFERGVEMIIALLAVMKAGGIYVPVDPVNPIARCKLLMADVGSKYLLTHHELHHRQLHGPWKEIQLSGPGSDWRNASSAPPNIYLQGTDLAYVIYTSGSTGKPKSVSIPHHAIVDHHLAMTKAIGFNAEDVFLNVASLAFDPSVQDFYLPLMIGAQVVVASSEEKVDGRLLGALINEVDATVLQATPATYRLLMLGGWNGKNNITLLSGGEGLNRSLADLLLANCSRLFNIYGPTETTIWSTFYQVSSEGRLPSTSGFEPVGKPLDNVQLYLLDSKMKAVPIGVPGELYIGGVGVSPTGYLGNKELNDFHFVKHPKKEETIYRTGDLAKYLINGNLEFIGRKDGQVKIRGHRIEVGEIEAFLSTYEQVKDNVIIARPNKKGEKSLVAYVIKSNGIPFDTEEAKEFLRKELPAYMVPNHWVAIDEFPLTTTQKIDRRKLPEPDWNSQSNGKAMIEPSTKEEKIVAEIWKDVLGLSVANVHDDFFAIGGHSLIAVDLMARLEKAVGKKMPLSALMEHPTIAQLARLISFDQETNVGGSCVTIKATGSKPPIFLVHGAGLHVLMYQTLAEGMDIDQPIYGFQARGLYGEAEPLDRIEDMAAAYIDEILAKYPNGPYALAGYSFGGLITFEMAKQLKSRGKEVAMLGMFDTVVRPEITGEKWSYYQSLNRLGKKVAWNLGAIAKDPIDNFKYKSNTISRRLKRLTWSLGSGKNKVSEDNALDVNMALLDQKNKIAFENYRITPFDGEIHLFRAKVQRFWIEDFEFLGWKPFANKGIVVHEVPGDHLHLFTPPNGYEFAKILQSVLDYVYANKDFNR